MTDVVRLAANENPLGPSPRVREAVSRSCQTLNFYPEPDASSLRQALANDHAITPDMVVTGAGSSALLKLVADAYLRPGDEALIGDICFPVYEHVTRAAGATPLIVPLDCNLDYDLGPMLSAVTDRTRLVFLASPNNPTGKRIPFADLTSFIERLPRRVLCVLDLAYWEYVEADADGNPMRLVDAHQNLVILRTFSKVYSLAALRVGYGIANPEIIKRLDQVRLPYGTSGVAQSAAQIALSDQDHVARSVALNRKAIAILMRGLKALGFAARQSDANFLLVDFHVDAEGLSRRLLHHGFLVQPMRHPRLKTCLRISTGTESQMHQLLGALRAELGVRSVSSKAFCGGQHHAFPSTPAIGREARESLTRTA